jgi:CRP-like cAMP-binding protein
MVTRLNAGSTKDTSSQLYDGSVGPEFRMVVEQMGQVYEFAPRERVRPEIGNKHAFYLIESGVMTLSLVTANGHDLIAGLFFEGDTIGLEQHGESAGEYMTTAFEPVRVRVLPLTKLMAACRRDPLLFGEVLRLASRRLEQLRQHKLSVVRNDALGRVAGFLGELARRRSEPDGSLRLPLSRNDIGSYLCLSLETVSRSLGQLESDGVIRKHGRFVRVLDDGRLAALTDTAGAPEDAPSICPGGVNNAATGTRSGRVAAIVNVV